MKTDPISYNVIVNQLDLEWGYPRDGQQIKIKFVGGVLCGELTAVSHDGQLIKLFERSLRDGKQLTISISGEKSDLDEARDLLKQGKDKQAIAKALDILERLDK